MRWREPVSDPIRIAFTGDFMPGLLDQGGARISESLLGLFRSDRIVMVNLESPLTTALSQKPRGTSLVSDPSAVRHLKAMNVTVANLANNHTMDRGRPGLEETLRVLADNGIASLGAGPDIKDAARPYVWQGDGLKIVFLSSSYEATDVTSTAGPTSAGANPLILPDMRKAVAAWKDKGFIVCLSYHGGTEFFRYPCPVKRDLMRAMSGWGADMVIGHHAHLFQGLEIFGPENRIIAHGLGNFALTTASQVSHRGTEFGLILEVEVDAQGPLGCSTLFVHNDRRRGALELVRGDADAALRGLLEGLSKAVGDERRHVREWRRDCGRSLLGLNESERPALARRLVRAIRNSWGALKRLLREGPPSPPEDKARHVCTRQEMTLAAMHGVPSMLISPFRLLDCYAAYDRASRFQARSRADSGPATAGSRS